MRSVLILIVGLATGCAAGQGGSSEPVTRAEIVESEATDAYEALRLLRPRWLQRTEDASGMAVRREVGRPPPPGGGDSSGCRWSAYLGDTGIDGDDLRNVPAVTIAELRLIPARARRPDGSMCSHDAPAIHVVLLTGATGDRT